MPLHKVRIEKEKQEREKIAEEQRLASLTWKDKVQEYFGMR